LNKNQWRKLEILLFSRDDTYGCVNLVDRYFELKEILEQEKLQAAQLAMEGRALTWF